MTKEGAEQQAKERESRLRELFIPVLDWVLEQQMSGHRPDDRDVADHFDIPLEDAERIHDLLEAAGEFD